jgi:hypothetical protein
MLKKITSVDWRLVSDLGPMAATPMGPKSDGKPVRFAVFPVQPDADMGDRVLRRFGRFDDLHAMPVARQHAQKAALQQEESEP